MIVEIELSEIEKYAVLSHEYRHDVMRSGHTVAALILTKLADTVTHSDIRVGDIVAWGPRPYGATGLAVLAVDGDIAWLRDRDGWYHHLPVSELRKPHPSEL